MPLHSQLKQLKLKKAEVSSQFKRVDKNSQAFASLLDAMQAVTEDIKRVEAEIKHQKSAADKLGGGTDSVPVLGAHFETSWMVEDWPKAFELRELLLNEYPLWWAFLENKTSLTGYLQPSWLHVIKKAFGHRVTIFVAVSSEGEILGGVPLVMFSSLTFGRFAVSLPFVNYGGVVTEWANIATALIVGARDLCAKYQLKYVEIRTLLPNLQVHSSPSTKKVSMVLPLPTTLEALEMRLGSKIRAQCKKALVYSPVFKVGGLDLLGDFYAVFAKNMRDLGTPVYHKNWFKQVLLEPNIEAVVVLVYMAGKPVSAGFLVGHNDVLEIPWASTLKCANLKNANMWMYRQVLDYAVSSGYRYFDFGRSTKDSGTYQFKKQWGAIAVEHFWYYARLTDQIDPGLNPDNPKFKLAIQIWRCLPVWLTKLIGPPIVKHLP